MDLLTGAATRLRSDFLMTSRLGAYRDFLRSAQAAGYRIQPVGTFWKRLDEGPIDPTERHLILRHDIDTDPGTAARMWAIDRELGVTASFFFRLSTLDPALMADIAANGGEASYHYEELATVAKRRGLRRRSSALAHLPEARDLFARNIERLRRKTGLPMWVVASHGDFVNRRLGIANSIVLADPDHRRAVGIELETYDQALLEHLPSRYIDAIAPDHWNPADPAQAIVAGEPVISILVHPRQWQADRRVNAVDDVRRVVEGVRYEFVGRRWQRR